MGAKSFRICTLLFPNITYQWIFSRLAQAVAHQSSHDIAESMDRSHLQISFVWPWYLRRWMPDIYCHRVKLVSIPNKVKGTPPRIKGLTHYKQSLMMGWPYPTYRWLDHRRSESRRLVRSAPSAWGIHTGIDRFRFHGFHAFQTQFSGCISSRPQKRRPIFRCTMTLESTGALEWPSKAPGHPENGGYHFFGITE